MDELERYYDETNAPCLEWLCLDSIVKHFRRFYFAFTVSKDATLQRSMDFLFLQREFSNELAYELLSDKKMTDVYFDFLINEHLTSVHMKWFKKSRYMKCLDDIFSRLPNLETIDFEDSAYGDEILKSIVKFCPRINEIDAVFSSVSDTGIKHLCETKNGRIPCPELESITLIGSRVSAEGVECLIRSVPSLEIVQYEYLPSVLQSIYTKNASQQEKMSFFNITELQLCDYELQLDDLCFHEVLKACSIVCPKLESLDCGLSEIEQLDGIMNSDLRLKKLELWFSEGSSHVNIDNLLKANGHNLTDLCISCCSVSVSALAVHCPVLKKFKSFNVDFKDAADNSLPLFFPSLTSCELYYDSTTAVTKAFGLISSSPKLETVQIMYDNGEGILSSEMKDEILMWCKESAAKVLRLFSLHIEINFLKEILNNGSLKWLGIHSCIYDVDNPDEILKCLAEKYRTKLRIDLLKV